MADRGSRPGPAPGLPVSRSRLFRFCTYNPCHAAETDRLEWISQELRNVNVAALVGTGKRYWPIPGTPYAPIAQQTTQNLMALLTST